MGANITVELKHETGRVEKIPYVNSIHTVDGFIEVSFLMPGTDDESHTEQYGSMGWRVTSVYPTDEQD